MVKWETLLVCIILSGCGVVSKKHAQKNETENTASAAFKNAAQKYHIPLRFLMAIPYLESAMTPEKESVLQNGKTVSVGFGETAFGLSLATLKLPADESSQKLPNQIEAYAKWLSESLRQANLPSDIDTSEDMYKWIWEIAQVQRQGQPVKRNVRAVFALELIDLLNKGYIWEDPHTGELLELKKAEPVLKVDDFEESSQNNLKLTTRSGEVPSAKMFLLVATSPKTEKQNPKGIEIVHCPFTFSACLEWLNENNQKDTLSLTKSGFAAHYIIPQSEQYSEVPLQIAMHDSRLFDAQKSQNKDVDRIVIMLTGNSGRIVGGKRKQVNPQWITKWELQKLGELVQDICAKLVDIDQSDNPSSTYKIADCVKIGGGVKIRGGIEGEHSLGISGQKSTVDSFWGDVPDLDPTILSAYFQSSEGNSGITNLGFQSSKPAFKIGEKIQMGVSFPQGIQHLVLEKLVQCTDTNQTFWETLTTEEIRNSQKFQIAKSFFDPGPNGDGKQFLRAKVFNDKDQLVGWDMASFILQGYDSKSFKRTCG